ncbi:hypothetical protein HanRHA438_Chr12g0553061 [Helianthus annuus]|nr:hypothetical protein HanHA89_Chr12g0469211 [Helianthus annuus]KAJ0674992.1 hypothetical protein HanLR1_Chr12g0446221 [Helianthus annuus]KAJ0866546.1 hypothetical protein HanRHA438_Chr12g0553061 [Helianthus annuus]
MLLDADADYDVDLFDDEPLEDDIEGEALIADGGLLLLADAPAEESTAHSPVPDSFESLASAPSHTQGAQHYSHASDPDRASSAAPAPSYAFDHDLDEDSDPIFPPGFNPDQYIEFIPLDQPMEDPVDPVDPVDPAFADHADFEIEFDDLEPAMAPKPVATPDPVFEHDPVHAGVPIVDPVIADLPVDDHPVDAPLLEGDYVVAADQADAPSSLTYPLSPDHALFATRIDPHYSHTQNGWIDADDEHPPFPPHTTDARHMDFPFSFAQFTTSARPGEGSSAHPFVHVPTSILVIPQFSFAIPHVPPFSVPPFTPASEPFFWTSPPIMPPSDPYHPFHMGYSIEDIFMSFVLQQEALTRRIQELERAQPPPCQCQGQTHPSISQPPRPLSPDSAARLLALEQQMASWLRSQRAMEEDWLHLRRLFYSHFPPPPPLSV